MKKTLKKRILSRMTPLSSCRSFRLVCPPHQIPLVESLLTEQGFVFEPEEFSPFARRLLDEPFPLGRSQAAFWGLIYIQDRSSMLPPLALNPPKQSQVLDMCASPGSKTGLLAQLVGKDGLVLANEPTRPRLATLRQNLLNLNLLQVVTCSWQGEALPLPEASWHYILLDPPCSGWGTVEKNPRVTTLWRDKKIAPLIALQRTLLQEASRLLAPNGQLLYSTCTTNVAENEEQIVFALEHCGLVLEQLHPFPDFMFDDPLLKSCSGVLRVNGKESSAQGFFLAKLRKPTDSIQATTADNKANFSANFFAETSREKPLKSLKTTPDFIPLPQLSNFGLNPDLFPKGQIGRFGDKLHFLPDLALQNLPNTLRWQGAALGKTPSPRLRFFDKAYAQTLPHVLLLDVENVADLEALVQGRSLTVADLKQKEALLFWRGLPLGRLKIKNTRAIWSEH